MCLIIFRWQPDHPNLLTLLSNRDEFYARDSLEAHYWNDRTDIYGGRDQEKHGTWLAVSRQGRLACVTNYREPNPPSQVRSRGEIPLAFLDQQRPADVFALELSQRHEEYPGFNALFFDGEQLVYSSNRSAEKPQTLDAGIYGVSNHLLNTPWPKVTRAKQSFTECLADFPNPNPLRSDKLLSIMQSKSLAEDHELPDTGVPYEFEKLLSAIFIESPSYGTRTTTLVEVTGRNHMEITEQNFSYGEDAQAPVIERFEIKES